MNDLDSGLILNITGNGKGKTTGALGIVIRALGWEWRAAVIQFMKSSRETGELQFFRRFFPGMIFEQYGLGLTSRPGDHAGAARRGWERAKCLLADFEGKLLVLDELNVALSHGFLDVADVVSAFRGKRHGLNVVVTGRGAPAELLEISDMVSDIAEIKHQYRRRIPAGKGLDF